MPLLIGGTISVIFGLISLIFFWSDFVTIIMGSLPVFLLLGGALAVYVGLEELQEKLREERQLQEEKYEKAQEEIELIKAQAERYKAELDRLKETKE